jgi:hypothetical protein
VPEEKRRKTWKSTKSDRFAIYVQNSKKVTKKEDLFLKFFWFGKHCEMVFVKKI